MFPCTFISKSSIPIPIPTYTGNLVWNQSFTIIITPLIINIVGKILSQVLNIWAHYYIERLP